MLPELNPVELIFLAAVALIVIGPKDLPVVLRKVGQWTAKMRGLAAEFRASFDEMARQSELDELRKEVEALRTGQLGVGHTPDLQTHVDEINQHLSTPYWDGPNTTYETPSVEGEEVAALPPPTAAEAPRAPRKRAAKPKLDAPSSEGAEAFADAAPVDKPLRKRAKIASAAEAVNATEAGVDGSLA